MPAQVRLTAETRPERNLLWQGGFFNLLVYPGLKLHNSSYLGHSFVEIPNNPKVEENLARSFVHDGDSITLGKLLRQKRKWLAICEVDLWEIIYPSGGICYFIDYKLTVATTATRTLSVVRREHAEKMPRHMGGTMISI